MTPESIREYVQKNPNVNDMDRSILLFAADEIARLQKDAKRYRMARLLVQSSQPCGDGTQWRVDTQLRQQITRSTASDFDAAIDEALESES